MTNEDCMALAREYGLEDLTLERAEDYLRLGIRTVTGSMTITLRGKGCDEEGTVRECLEVLGQEQCRITKAS
jgi:hypothetical protein